MGPKKLLLCGRSFFTPILDLARGARHGENYLELEVQGVTTILCILSLKIFGLYPQHCQGRNWAILRGGAGIFIIGRMS